MHLLEKYGNLCKEADELLRRRLKPARVAIPLFHILREHPVFLKNYGFSFDNTSSPEKSVFGEPSSNSIISKVKNKLSDLLSRSDEISNIGSLDTCDILIISHLLKPEQLSSPEDFYFANIPQALENDGFKVVVLLINHTGKSLSEISDSSGFSHKVKRLVLPAKVGVLNDLKLYGLLLWELVNLLHERNRYKTEFGSHFSSIGFVSGGLAVLRLGEIVKRLLHRFSPKCLLTTYEGHSWERLLYKYAFDYDPHIYRIGYQHSVITKRSHAIKRMLGGNYDPDLILSSGTVTKKIFDETLKSWERNVKVLGSRKLAGLQFYQHEKNSGDVCLVLPEGIPEECDALFRFSLSCARKIPEMQFIWRLHPLMNFDELFEFMSLSPNELPDNVQASHASLESDINKSNWALYRGTTAIIEAVFGGVTPVYLSDGSGLSIDILYDVGEERIIVSSETEFIKAVTSGKRKKVEGLVDYCCRYFSPLDLSVLTSALREI